MTATQSDAKSLHLDAGPHCVLMLHGLGAAPLELARLANDAHQEGFSVRAPLIDGYGFGTPPQTWSHWRDQVLAHYWACQKSHDTVSVLGVSMGATLALMLAETETPTAVVALSAALGYDGWAIPWYHPLLSLTRWIPFAGRYEYIEREPFGLKNKETRAMVVRMMKSQHISEVGAERLPLRLIQEGKKLIRSVKAHAHDLHAPLLLMHAVDDESVHIRNPQALFEEVASTVKEFIYLGDSYHTITIDNERDMVRKESLRFLKSAVNRSIGESVFEVPSIQTYELRRQLEIA